MRAKSHKILIRYGYLTPRLEPCGYPRCVVEDGVSSCGRLACEACGAGPVEVVEPVPGGTWCDACGTYKPMLF